MGLDDDRIHAPNEKVEMALLLRGAEAVAYLWEDLAADRAGITAHPMSAAQGDRGRRAGCPGVRS